MSKLVLASSNRGKLAEFRQGLAGSGLKLLAASDVGLENFPPETGDSYAANARLKAEYGVSSGLPCLADDSGLEVNALGGAPGIYSSRYGGLKSPEARLHYLLGKLRDVPPEARGARFVCALVLLTPQGHSRTFHGKCYGDILMAPRGTGGFGYDPIFYSPELSKSFAEAAEDEKRRVSHRGRALEKFLEWAQSADSQRILSEP